MLFSHRMAEMSYKRSERETTVRQRETPSSLVVANVGLPASGSIIGWGLYESRIPFVGAALRHHFQFVLYIICLRYVYVFCNCLKCVSSGDNLTQCSNLFSACTRHGVLLTQQQRRSDNRESSYINITFTKYVCFTRFQSY